jgi:hypothetical protein
LIRLRDAESIHDAVDYLGMSDKVYAVFNAVFNSGASKEIVNNVTREKW